LAAMASTSTAGSPIKESFPLHAAVWNDDTDWLKRQLAELNTDASSSEAVTAKLELKDPRHRTALQLAVVLCRVDCAKLLLDAGASTQANDGIWDVLDEAISRSDVELTSSVLSYRILQMQRHFNADTRRLLQQLNESPDFYVELKWDFSSWIPLISRYCPNDSCRVYKSGSLVRVDSTLIGMDGTTAVRGNLSYIFRLSESGLRLDIVNHDKRTVIQETLSDLTGSAAGGEGLAESRQPEVALLGQVEYLLSRPVRGTRVLLENVVFERSKSGILGWKGERTETVAGRECKVFSASGVRVLNFRRTDHLTAEQKAELQSSANPLASLVQSERRLEYVPGAVSAQEYFNRQLSLAGRDVGVPRDISLREHSFTAKLWMCDSFPLNLQDQVLPVLDLMANKSAHFSQLREFVTLQLPAGFPLRVEIPLHTLLQANVSFCNLFAADSPAEHVSCLRDVVQEESRGPDHVYCAVDERAFAIPGGYRLLSNRRPRFSPMGREEDYYASTMAASSGGGSEFEQQFTEEQDLLQMALAQSDLQKAIEDSLLSAAIEGGGGEAAEEGSSAEDSSGRQQQQQQQLTAYELLREQSQQQPPQPAEVDPELAEAVRLSEQAEAERRRLVEDEEEQLRRVLELSQTEK
ncbi:hypothetical protein BOX15_Mlig009055g1, partial [Macrostomum lignano]